MKVSKIRQNTSTSAYGFVLSTPTPNRCSCSLKSAHGCPSRHRQRRACPNARSHKKLQLILDGISFIKGAPVLFPTPRRSHALPCAGAGIHTAHAVSRLSSSQTLCFPFGKASFSATSVSLADDGITASKGSGVRSA